jgi:hypothetical protein
MNEYKIIRIDDFEKVVNGNYNCTDFGNWECTKNGNNRAQDYWFKIINILIA